MDKVKENETKLAAKVNFEKELELVEIAVNRTELKLKNEELVISKKETNMKEEEGKQITKKNYLNLKETNLSKREAIIANKDKITLEVEQDNKK